MHHPSSSPVSGPVGNDSNDNLPAIQTRVNDDAIGTMKESTSPKSSTAQSESIRLALPSIDQPHASHAPESSNISVRNSSQSTLTTKSAQHPNNRSAPYIKPKGGYPATRNLPGQGKPRLQFLLDTPTLDYFLPPGDPINATLSEIIVLLPHWFKNRDIAVRFQNNGITAAIHFEILKEYRHMELNPRGEYDRPFEHITDMYRKTMRKIDVNWTKTRHAAPATWNPHFMMINNFLPESALQSGYNAPASIPFRELATNLKKLPQAYDAGDITRALEHAMQYSKVDSHGQPIDFLFPDDIHIILDRIGRTMITLDHTDRNIVGRYNTIVRLADGERRQRLNAEKERKRIAEQLAAQSTEVSQYHHHHHPPPPPPRGLQPLLPQPVHQSAQHHVPQQLSAPQPPAHGTSQDNLAQQPYALQQFPVAPSNFPFLNEGYNILQHNDQQQPQAPALEYSFLDVGYDGLPSMDEHALQNVPQDMTQNNGYRTGLAADSGRYVNYPVVPAQRSNSQEAAAEVVSHIVSHGAERVAYDDTGLPPIPDICNLEPDPDQLRLGLNAYGQPVHQPDEPINLEGFDIDALMAANQAYDPIGLPTPSPESKRTRKHHPSELLRDCPEADDENDHRNLARASRWARRDEISGCDLTVADLDMVMQLVDQVGGELLALRSKE